MVLKTSTFWETMKHPDTLAYAFWLSVSLLVLVSLLKYFISKESERKDWGYFILEFPIDVCLVVITIIITGYMKNENMPLGIIFVILSLIISIFCCIMRRFSLKYSKVDQLGLSQSECFACISHELGHFLDQSDRSTTPQQTREINADKLAVKLGLAKSLQSALDKLINDNPDNQELVKGMQDRISYWISNQASSF